MTVCTNISDLNTILEPLRNQGKRLGFVPTMGALHQGHLSLVERAMAENDCVVLSIFVNPTQFDKKDDLDKYPRTLEHDLDLLRKAAPATIVFYPDTASLYEGEVKAKNYDFGGLEKEMEGAYRKGHFSGVATVVSLLLRAIMPHKAYFGEKDYQQLLIVRKLVAVENLPVAIVGCPIVREANGLAMSSRNKRLSGTQFEKASLIYRSLQEVKDRFQSASIAQLKELLAARFASEPELELEYFEIAEADTLKPANEKKAGTRYRAFLAVFAGPVRLIDNMALN